MRTLKFHHHVYSGRAIDDALGRLARFGNIDRSFEGEYFVVHVSAGSPAKERQLAGEIANHALGLTVERGGPDPREPEAK